MTDYEADGFLVKVRQELVRLEASLGSSYITGRRLFIQPCEVGGWVFKSHIGQVRYYGDLDGVKQLGTLNDEPALIARRLLWEIQKHATGG